MGPIKFCLQDALPTVFTDDLGFIEVIGKIIEKMNEVIEQLNILDPIDTTEIQRIAREAAIAVTNEHIATYVRVYDVGGIAQTTPTERAQFYTDGTRFFLEPNENGIWIMYTLQSTGAYFAIGNTGGGGGAVNSVNGETGDVRVRSLLSPTGSTRVTYTGGDTIELKNYNASDVFTTRLTVRTDGGIIAGAETGGVQQYSSVFPPPYPVTSVNGKTGNVVIEATGGVTSVNGKTGAVTITAADLGAYTAANQPPYPVTSVNGQTGDVVVSAGSVTSVNGLTGVVELKSLPVSGEPSSQFNVTRNNDDKSYYIGVNTGSSNKFLKFYDNGVVSANSIRQYSSLNPPPYPVSSVNGQTGAVNITTAALGAYSSSNPPPYPVTSVNGETGSVYINSINTADRSAFLRADFTNGNQWNFNASAGPSIAWTNSGLMQVAGVNQYSATVPPPYPVSTDSFMAGQQFKLWLTSAHNICLCFGSEIGSFRGSDMSYYFLVSNVTQIYWVLAVVPAEQCIQSINYVSISGSGNNVININFTPFDTINPPDTAAFRYLIYAT